jgi:acetyl-CoA carboxylase beta subunit
MSKTNNLAYESEVVADEDIQTALEVLSALKDELKAHTKRRIRCVADNDAWDAKVEGIEWQLRGNLSSIYCLKQELKHWVKRRLKAAQRNNRS